MPRDSSPEELLFAAHERAAKLCETLTRQAAELAAAHDMRPEIRDNGLTALRKAIASAQRLVVDTQSAVARANNLPIPHPNDTLAEVQRDD